MNRDINFEVIDLDRSKYSEKILDDLIQKYIYLNTQIEDPLTASIELIEAYLRVVRSRNKLRRNWNPIESSNCDLATLQWISKEQLRKGLKNLISDSLEVTSNGNRIITEEAAEKLEKDILNLLTKRTLKRAISTPRDEIIKDILHIYPNATYEEVNNEILANKTKYRVTPVGGKGYDVDCTNPNGSQRITKKKFYTWSGTSNAMTKISKTL
jgi:hypothetical protein